MEEAGDVVGGGHDIEDPHAAAALAADGDADGEDAGEEMGPADAARSGGGLGGGRRAVVVVEADIVTLEFMGQNTYFQRVVLSDP